MPCIAKVQERRIFCFTCNRTSKFVFNAYSDTSGKIAVRKEDSTACLFCISQQRCDQRLLNFWFQDAFQVINVHKEVLLVWVLSVDIYHRKNEN